MKQTVYELISGVERENIRDKIRKKRYFTRKPRQKSPPVLERITSTDHNSQECIIEAGKKGTVPSWVEEEEGEGGSSGTSRGISNRVIPFKNASIDSYAKELQDIVDGEENEGHLYYKLGPKLQYRQIHYHSEKLEYTVHAPKNPPTAEESSVPSVSGEFAPTSTT